MLFHLSLYIYIFMLELFSSFLNSQLSQVDTASEVEELDIDAAPAPYTGSRGATKLQVFIARYR